MDFLLRKLWIVSRPDQCLQSIDELGIDPLVQVSVIMENYVHLLLLSPPFCQRKTSEYKIHEQPLLVVLTSLAWRAFVQDSWQRCLESCWQSLLYGFFDLDTKIGDTNLSSKHGYLPPRGPLSLRTKYKIEPTPHQLIGALAHLLNLNLFHL